MQKVTKVPRFIVSYCVSHNLCIENNDFLEEKAIMSFIQNITVIPSRDNDLTLRRKVEKRDLPLEIF